MARMIRVDLYCEDRGHEDFVRALLLRLGREEAVELALQVRAGRGGHAAALTEFDTWQRAKRRGTDNETPDLLILVIDGNCEGPTQAKKRISEAVDPWIFPRFVVGCPDPHVERWCLADPPTFAEVVGRAPGPDPGKCERQIYKHLLRENILAAGQPILTDAMEFAPDLVAAMDLYRAGKSQPSLRHFVDELRGALRHYAR
jgi:hypothetical protein